MKRYYLIALLLIAGFSNTFSQQWVETYQFSTGTFKNGEDKALAMAVDGNENVYQTGFFSFSETIKHIFLIKYSSEGTFMWVKTPLLGNTEDKAYAITVDDLDNVYVTGYSRNLSSGSADIIVMKYSSSGDSLWTSFFNGTGNAEDKAYAIKIDESDNIYVAGSSAGLNSGLDYIVIKYNSSGTRLWDARFNGVGNDEDVATSLVLDGNGNPIVTGYSKNSHQEGTDDIATIKFNKTNGSRAWVNLFNGCTNGSGNLSDKAYAITVDRDNFVYVTGYVTQSTAQNKDMVTLCYTPGGARKWVSIYNNESINSDDIGYCIAATNNNNIVVSGSSKSSSANGSEDYVTIDYHSNNGNQKWINKFNGPGNGSDVATCMALSPSNNEVYVSGFSQENSQSSRFDILTFEFKIANGDLLDSAKFNTTGNDDNRPTCIISDEFQNVIGGNLVPHEVFMTNPSHVKSNSDIMAVGYLGGGLTQKYGPASIKNAQTNTRLYQNSPNPFNPVTHIKFYLPISSSVRLTVFDLLGRTVEILADGNMGEGEHEVLFNGSNLSSGIYFYELNVNGVKAIKKMILTK